MNYSHNYPSSAPIRAAVLAFAIACLFVFGPKACEPVPPKYVLPILPPVVQTAGDNFSW